MEKLGEMFREKPWLWAVVGLGIFVLFRLGGGSSSGGGGNSVEATLQSQSLANEANVALSSINAQVQMAQNENASSVIAALAEISGAVTMGKDKAAVDSYTITMQRLNNADLIQAQREFDSQSIRSNQQIALSGMQKEIALADRQLSMVNINAQTVTRGFEADVAMANIAAQTGLQQTNMILNHEALTLPSILQHEYAMQQMVEDVNLKLGFWGIEANKEINRDNNSVDRMAILTNYKLGKASVRAERNQGYLETIGRAVAAYYTMGASEAARSADS
jgi:hypothetical protein